MEYNWKWYTSVPIQPHTELPPKVPPDLVRDSVQRPLVNTLGLLGKSTPHTDNSLRSSWGHLANAGNKAQEALTRTHLNAQSLQNAPLGGETVRVQKSWAGIERGEVQRFSYSKGMNRIRNLVCTWTSERRITTSVASSSGHTTLIVYSR